MGVAIVWALYIEVLLKVYRYIHSRTCAYNHVIAYVFTGKLHIFLVDSQLTWEFWQNEFNFRKRYPRFALFTFQLPQNVKCLENGSNDMLCSILFIFSGTCVNIIYLSIYLFTYLYVYQYVLVSLWKFPLHTALVLALRISGPPLAHYHIRTAGPTHSNTRAHTSTGPQWHWLLQFFLSPDLLFGYFTTSTLGIIHVWSWVFSILSSFLIHGTFK